MFIKRVGVEKKLVYGLVDTVDQTTFFRCGRP